MDGGNSYAVHVNVSVSNYKSNNLKEGCRTVTPAVKRMCFLIMREFQSIIYEIDKVSRHS